MLVVDLHALDAVHFLDFIHQVFLHRAHTLDPQDVVRVDRAVGQAVRRRGLELKWEAEKWLSRCWFTTSGLRLTFWGEQWMGVLGGLLLKKPLYYDNYKTGVLYREFVALEEVALTESILRQVQAVDRLLSVMKIDLGPVSQYGFLTYKNLILSRWAGHCLGLRQEKGGRHLGRRLQGVFRGSFCRASPPPSQRRRAAFPKR